MSTKTTTLTASSLSRTLRSWGYNTRGPVKVSAWTPGCVKVQVDGPPPNRALGVAIAIANSLRDAGYQVDLDEMYGVMWVGRQQVGEQ